MWLGFSDESKISKIQCQFMYPATDMLIKKYSSKKKFFVRETPDMYFNITKPLLVDKIDPSSVDWLYNILEHKKEVEFRVCETPEFILNKDWEFNEGALETMYCLAMPQDRSLKSVRDLNETHLPLLKSIREESMKAIDEKFGLKKEEVVAFFHYPPTYYHLHIHFIHMKMLFDHSPTRTVFLDDVIENIEMYGGDYY